MKIMEAGLIKSRHEIPVDQYIFNDAIEDVHDYGAMWCTVIDWIYKRSSKDDVVKLRVYVTGLTAAMLAVVKVCNDLNDRGWNIALFAMNYDLDTRSYREEEVLSWRKR